MTLHSSSGAVGFFPGIVTARFYETWDFYTAILGFRTISERDCHVQLVHPQGAQLGILRHETDGLHAELISAIEGRGFWFTLELEDYDGECSRLRQAGIHLESLPAQPSSDARQCVVRDPNGILICLLEKSSVATADVAMG